MKSGPPADCSGPYGRSVQSQHGTSCSVTYGLRCHGGRCCILCVGRARPTTQVKPNAAPVTSLARRGAGKTRARPGSGAGACVKDEVLVQRAGPGTRTPRRLTCPTLAAPSRPRCARCWSARFRVSALVPTALASRVSNHPPPARSASTVRWSPLASPSTPGRPRTSLTGSGVLLEDTDGRSMRFVEPFGGRSDRNR